MCVPIQTTVLMNEFWKMSKTRKTKSKKIWNFKCCYSTMLHPNGIHLNNDNNNNETCNLIDNRRVDSCTKSLHVFSVSFYNVYIHCIQLPKKKTHQLCYHSFESFEWSVECFRSRFSSNVSPNSQIPVWIFFILNYFPTGAYSFCNSLKWKFVKFGFLSALSVLFCI